MSSVYLSSSAQTALAILNEIDRASDQTQRTVATGRKINTAADNPAIWAVSQDLNSDLASYAALNDTLTAGKAPISLARSGAESVVSFLSEIKEEIIASSATGALSATNQDAIEDLRAQIETVVASAGVSGVNLLQNAASSTNATYSVLGSVYEGSNGSIQTLQITTSKQDLQTSTASFGAGAVTLGDYFSAGGGAVAASGGSQDIDIASATVAKGASYRITLTGDNGHDLATAAPSGVSFEYVARTGDTNADVATQLQAQIDDYISANSLSGSLSVAVDTTNGRVTVTNSDADAADTVSVTLAAATGGTAGGGLSALSSMDVTTESGRNLALSTIDTLIDQATAAAASFGVSERRIDIQSDFLASASIEIAKGISGLVDADLNAESARLKAQEAQRELAIQMISIANNRAESLLSLFD